RRQPSLAPLEIRSEKCRQKHQRRADEVKQEVRREIPDRDRMSRRFLAHRLAPAEPNPAIVRIADEPVSKPPECKQQKDQTRREHTQNLSPPELPSQSKRRKQQPWRIEPNGFTKIHTQAHQTRGNQYQPELVLLHSAQVNDQCSREHEH